MTDEQVSGENYRRVLAIAEGLEIELQAARGSLADVNSLMQDDLGMLLRALGMSDHPRPQSPHEVMQQAIEQAGAWRRCLMQVRYVLRYSTVHSDTYREVTDSLSPRPSP